MALIAKHILVKGKVQGVFFRKNTKTKADELNITGWVKNTDDGHVEIIAQATENALQQFIEWCKEGPSRANVSDVIIKDAKPDHQLQEFIIDR